MRGPSPVQVDVGGNEAGPGPSSTSLRFDRHDRHLEHLPAYPCAKLKLDQLFLQWLSEHQDTVNQLLEDAKAGRPIRGPTPQVAASPLSPSTAHVIFSSTPPISPSRTRSPGTPLSPQRRSVSTLAPKRQQPLAVIPQFYFPTVAAQPQTKAAAQTEWEQHVGQFYAQHGPALAQREFMDCLMEVSDLPSMAVHLLFRSLAGSDNGMVTHEQLAGFWAERDLYAATPAARLYEVLRPQGQKYVSYADLLKMLECVVAFHPGLEFLHDTSEFQQKYSETVVFRILYALNRKGDGQLSLREVQRGDLLEALQWLDKEPDINKVLKYFCYEHFYVIYCKFWELDTDHDFMIDRNDLARYSQCALSFAIIDRIFEQAGRPFRCKVPGKMGYEDFCWFILSEEDKTTDTALEYWFRCVDLDGDGMIRPREMWVFYEETLKRLESMSQEPVLFEDYLCQLHDMLQPQKEGIYTLRDLKRTRPQSGLLFNGLFNLHKFVLFENRDPFQMRAEAVENAGLSDWDKFAKSEYLRLASEDEQETGIDANEDLVM